MMENLKFNTQNILDGQGIELAIAGMLIVFVVLTLISIFIALLPKILTVIARKYPEQDLHTAPQPEGPSNHETVLAAIGYVLHTRLRQKG